MKYKNIFHFRTIIIIIILVVLGIIIWNKVTFLDRIVIDGRNNWDIFSSQNTIVYGEQMGFIYERDYDIYTLPSKYLNSLIVDQYIESDGTFYEDQYLVDGLLYQKKVEKKVLDSLVKKMFGPNFKEVFDIENVSYGCGRGLVVFEDYYLISAYSPDYCGVFSNKEPFYVTHIQDYYKEQEDIIIKINVGYVEIDLEENEEEEYVNYSVYHNKNKDYLIDDHYDANCLFELRNDSCYVDFLTYHVVLKKSSDRQYHFYAIYREKLEN